MNPGKERCGGNVETGLTPFLFHLSQLILELATHCSRRAEIAGWGVCVLARLFHLVFFLGTPGVQRKKETMGQCSHRMGLWPNVMHFSCH